MVNVITSYELLGDGCKHVAVFPILEESFKNANRRTDVNNYSVNCLTYREQVPEDDAKIVRSRLKGGILEMGYDTLSSFGKKYKEYDEKAKKFSFLRYINPFAKGKTKAERLTPLPYIAPLSIGIGLDLILPAIGLNTTPIGIIVGGSLNAEGIVFGEINRRKNEKNGVDERELIASRLCDPKTSFFSDFLEQIEKTDVNFTTVKSANNYIENAVLPARDFAEIDFTRVNEKLIEEYKQFALQPKT